MEKEIINKILSKMECELSYTQLMKLEVVLSEIEIEKLLYNNKSRKTNLVKQFINAKRIEGCSKRTENFYLNTLLFYENTIGHDICYVST